MGFNVEDVPLLTSHTLIATYKAQIATHTAEVKRHTDAILRLNQLIKLHQTNIEAKRARLGHTEAAKIKGHE